MLLALLATSAFAGSLKIPAGKVESTTAAEVPLYAGLAADDPYVYVEAKAGEQKLFLRVSTSTSMVVLTEGAAAALKLKANKTTKAAKLKSLSLGDATMSGVTVYVTALADGDAAPYGVDGEIGIGAFPELSWAILRSSGKLRVGPGASGAAWVGEVGGSVPFASNPKSKVKIGKSKVDLERAPLIVSLAWDGVSIPTELATAGETTIAGEADQKDRWWTLKGVDVPTYALPTAPAYMNGESRFESRTVSIGTTQEAVTVSRASRGLEYAATVPAQVGVDVLQHYDVAVDAAGKTVGLRAVTTSALADATATHEAELRKALEPAPAKDGAAPDAAAAADARAAAIPPLVDWLSRTGKVEEALSLAKQRTELDGDDCTAWQDYGTAALAASRPAEAITGFQKAADLYAPWGALSLPERTKLKKEHAAAEKAKRAYAGSIPQSHACFTAWGGLARAHIANGHPEAVADLYPAKLDLDDGLATAAGTAALIRGDAVAAEGAFRQAIFLDPKNASTARKGLFLALPNRTLANAQLERGGLVADSPVAVSAYAEAIRKLEGGAKAIEAVKALADSRTNDAYILLELGRQYLKDGNAEGAAAQLRKARTLLSGRFASTSRDADLRSAWALLLLAEGKADAAKAETDSITTTQPGAATGWWAASIVAEAGGDAARAAELLRKAGAVATDNPLIAVAAAK